MNVTDLIRVLQVSREDHGDREVLHLSGEFAFEVTYLGAGTSEFGEYFWITSDDNLNLTDAEKEEYGAPHTPILTVVK